MSATRKLKRKSAPPVARTPIKDAWESYERHVLPSNASDVQRSETRRAFFAGASVLFQSLVEVSDDEERGMQLMDAVNAEVQVFGQELDADVFGQRMQRGPRGTA